MKKYLMISAIGLLSTIGCSNSNKETKTENESLVYQCPMDCDNGKTYDKPGKCAVCEMDLEKK